ncbi:hypothetical protein [Abyssogena phaseoliformis symbiont]|nr:hypothetical protein [Abyssogena phaseoliformis symbiont]MBW5289445.1 hypothetical protein [Candidatus Ruthia sp. Apha_13_S6]
MRGRVVFAGSELSLDNHIYQIIKVAHVLDKAWKTTLSFESLKGGGF